MTSDKYTAIWISHTTIKDFLYCPRAYYLKHVYKSPQTGHKMKIMIPPIALGQVVHEVLEEISRLPAASRLIQSLLGRFHQTWETLSGKNGGFSSSEQELRYKKRGEEMMGRLMKNPGPLLHSAVKLKGDLPFFWLSEEDNIILCGKLDWLEYVPESDSIHIIDFKTSQHDEDPNSLQLPIYHLLAHYCQKRKITKISYWYIDRVDGLIEKPLPDLVQSQQKIMAIGKKVKTARQLGIFKCPNGGNCPYCSPFEKIIQGKGLFIGLDSFEHDVYILPQETYTPEQESVIL